jgi:hypothetical protein
MNKEIFVHKKVLDDYEVKSRRDNRIRRFYSKIFKQIPRDLVEEAQDTFIDLEYSDEAQVGYTGVKAYRFKPRNCSNKLKLFFSEFIIFVEVVSPEWLQKKKPGRMKIL